MSHLPRLSQRAARRVAAVICLSAVLAVGGCAGTGTLEPPARGLRARQSAQWTKALASAPVEPGDILVVRLYGAFDDAAMEGATRPFSRAGVVDDQSAVVFGAGDLAQRMPLAAVIHEAHRLLLVRPNGLTAELRRRAGALVRGLAGQDLTSLGVIPAPPRERSAAFVLWALRAVLPSLDIEARDPADCLDVGTLVFDSGPRY